MISQTEFLLLRKIQEEKLHPEKRKQLAEYADWQAEKDIHSDIEAWLKRNEIPYIHSRMDKKSTIREGWPDFTAMRNGKVACVEIKTHPGIVSSVQSGAIADLEANGVPVLICYSLLEATRFFRKVLFP